MTATWIDVVFYLTIRPDGDLWRRKKKQKAEISTQTVYSSRGLWWGTRPPNLGILGGRLREVTLRTEVPSIFKIEGTSAHKATDCLIFKGERVVIPRASRGEILKRIHNPHLGVDGRLNRARECLYWPGMTGDIKNHESTCEARREYERAQPKETLMTDGTPHRP